MIVRGPPKGLFSERRGKRGTPKNIVLGRLELRPHPGGAGAGQAGPNTGPRFHRDLPERQIEASVRQECARPDFWESIENRLHRGRIAVAPVLPR